MKHPVARLRSALASAFGAVAKAAGATTADLATVERDLDEIEKALREPLDDEEGDGGDPGAPPFGDDEPDDDDDAGEDGDEADLVEKTTLGAAGAAPAPVTKGQEPTMTQPIKPEDGAGTPAPEDVLKALPDAARALVEKAQAQADAATKLAQEAIEKAERLEKAEAERAVLAKAETVLGQIGGDTAEMASVLKHLPAEEQAKLERIMKAANASIEMGGVFAERGKASTLAVGSAEAEIAAKAQARAVEKGITVEKATAEVIQSERALYARYRAEDDAKHGITRN